MKDALHRIGRMCNTLIKPSLAIRSTNSHLFGMFVHFRVTFLLCRTYCPVISANFPLIWLWRLRLKVFLFVNIDIFIGNGERIEAFYSRRNCISFIHVCISYIILLPIMPWRATYDNWRQGRSIPQSLNTRRYYVWTGVCVSHFQLFL